KLILRYTHWQIRLLSKSNLLPMIAKALVGNGLGRVHDRMIFGVSTGTLDDKLALSFEQGTPLPSKRLQSLWWLQDNGFRTFGMVCPSLPQWLPGRHEEDAYFEFAVEMREAIRAQKCEHVWAEVINARGESMKRTVAALREGGYGSLAAELDRISHDKAE